MPGKKSPEKQPVEEDKNNIEEKGDLTKKESDVKDEIDWEDWLDIYQPANAGQLEMQRAECGEMAVDPRNRIFGDDLKKNTFQSIGQFIMQFKPNQDNEETECKVFQGTGVLVQKLGGKKYSVLTAAHNFVSPVGFTLNDAMFILQRQGSKDYAAVFKFVKGSYQKHDKYEDVSAHDEGVYSGRDIGLAVVEQFRGGDIHIDFPKLQCFNADTTGKNILLAGYPNHIVNEQAWSDSKYWMYEQTGDLDAVVANPESKGEAIVLTQIFSSPGQSGAPMFVDHDDDKIPTIIGVHCGECETDNLTLDKNLKKKLDVDDYSCGTLITEGMLKNFINPTLDNYKVTYGDKQ